jgi:diguanylate cyclase (GGDEF)-like protein
MRKPRLWPGPGWLILILSLAFALPALAVSPGPNRLSTLLPWYVQKDFLIVADLAIFAIVVLGDVAWRHKKGIAYQSGHDPLTGLANRAVFEFTFQQAIADARAENSQIAMILLDLDRFKPINDTMGYVVGDRFLKEVSSRLKRVARKQDTVARIGGDEFAVLMPGLVTRAQAEFMAQRILDELREPYYIESFELSGSASIGISLFPEHGEDTATLERLADMAMYRCKAQNKDQYAIFDADVNRIDFRSAEMAGLIREALELGYFRVFYQPMTDPGGKLRALEALIRMDHPHYGPIPPGDFIPIAEDTGLIVRVGTWVLREACAQMVRWREAGHRDLRVSVNVSNLQLMKPDFAEGVKAILLRTGLDPCALTLEITETAMMRTWNQSRSQMEHLRSLGINIALDDFGTGYSTLNSLQLLPLDYIKIDRSFTERIGNNPDGLIVSEAIVDLAHKLSFEVIGEGVETHEQLAGLRSIGCDLLQGFLLGTPLSAEETGKLLASAVNRSGPNAGDTDATESLRSLARWTCPAIEASVLGD